MKKESVPHPKWLRTYKCSPTESCHGPWKSPVVSLVWPLLAFQSTTQWFAMAFERFCRLSPNYSYLTCQNFVCQLPVMAETTVKQRAFTFICPTFNIGVPGFFYIHDIFSAVNIYVIAHSGDSASLAEKLAPVKFRLLPRPLHLMQRSVAEA